MDPIEALETHLMYKDLFQTINFKVFSVNERESGRKVPLHLCETSNPTLTEQSIKSLGEISDYYLKNTVVIL